MDPFLFFLRPVLAFLPHNNNTTLQRWMVLLQSWLALEPIMSFPGIFMVSWGVVSVLCWSTVLFPRLSLHGDINIGHHPAQEIISMRRNWWMTTHWIIARNWERGVWTTRQQLTSSIFCPTELYFNHDDRSNSRYRTEPEQQQTRKWGRGDVYF